MSPAKGEITNFALKKIRRQEEVYTLNVQLLLVMLNMMSYQWQRDDEAMNVGLPRSLCDLSHRHYSTVVSVCDVISDTTVEQDGLLGDKPNLGAQPPDVVFTQWMSIDELQI